MATKRTGRLRGRPKKSFLSDPQRYALAFLDAVMLILKLEFEPAARLVLSYVDGKPMEIPPQPLKRARRLQLSQRTQRLLKEGWTLTWFETPHTVHGRIDALRKKEKRFASDESAQAWLFRMRSAWVALLCRDRYGPAAELLILTYASAAGERQYAEGCMLPFLRALTSPVNPGDADIK
jgi:hypothetical protein